MMTLQPAGLIDATNDTVICNFERNNCMYCMVVRIINLDDTSTGDASKSTP